MTDNPSAFPVHGGHEGDDCRNRILGGGMTLRDYFATHIASGMAAFSGTAGVSYGPHDIAGRAYEIAEAMLIARAALAGAASTGESEYLLAGANGDRLRGSVAELSPDKLREENDKLPEVAELQTIFDMRWAADQRAIKKWQSAHPGSERTWPDRTDMSVWMIEQVEQLDTLLRQRFARSSPIEEQLQLAGVGKRPLPTKEECLVWAAKLGVPEGYRK